MAEAELNPFTQVANTLWDLLNENDVFCTLVREGNQITFMGRDRNPMKSQISEGDLPEVRIVPINATPHLQRTSNSSSILIAWEIGLATGDQRIDAGLFELSWAIYRALRDWATKLSVLTWNSKTFVILARPRTIAFGVSNIDLERGIKGWSSLWSCETELWFTSADL